MINEYLFDLKKKGKSPKTVLSYGNDLHIFFCGTGTRAR